MQIEALQESPRGKDLQPADEGRWPASNHGGEGKCLLNLDAVLRHKEGDDVDVVAGEESVVG